ncbi:NADP-dependent phosphogluconate dehydrogenase [Tuwongella immobilis]|uniref:6-phosphogluconate dehydrogenase, decarboxylating n=1 Tax=Tuwongella immobilis TaxID=692036 RepID=A0A6C2YL73_9BACT|nr:NADP-dependent phosphogluconate dehydrogenase [Tuwongella immobilis]VIP01863.1 6-phosphogluconate dehydrogenase : 6-phosphogluconate dehydrogenase, decarboxylating OS=Joostella marina DSM 19592 GN=JoomaDRAFT_3023 PE=3 SV=1: NAD_binding_2: 6PGD [Tuwongella immobilis]VTR99677.1 6-phosphogluconate dehydrogenase : 6-phosphogluconate dehydrogenase, decarboxylating OS=Joostella marina DSM 19592 GN=JoomaDRAFT_3023 PE=3 SV=1: NAD_binding_2: 6PGD [Tuwongella immobilis]
MSQQYDIGLIGLGVMGRNLLLNIADHGFASAGFNRDPSKVAAFLEEGKGRTVFGTSDMKAFVEVIKKPRAMILLVQAGAAVDAVIQQLLPLIEPGDLIIDGGNSHFNDTNRRFEELKAKGIHFFGMGVSGGESGARYGPSIMPGGDRQAYERVKPILEAISAKVNGEPCVDYMGTGAAGHYVKMVHNGIEYAIMQMIAETYDVMRQVIGLTNDEMHAAFKAWNQGELASFLVEITADVFLKVDDKTGNRLLDMVRDVARQKGTGKWTSQAALDLGVPLSTIDSAVASRYLSSYDAERSEASKILTGPSPMPFTGDKQAAVQLLHDAFHVGMIVAYAQGMAMLHQADKAAGFGLNMEAVARIWRGGCIIRSKLLEDMRKAYSANNGLPNLLLDPTIGGLVSRKVPALRTILKHAIDAGIGAPALGTALAYFDNYRSNRLPLNIIQAQRDYFGAHTYERIDMPGTFHSSWTPE